MVIAPRCPLFQGPQGPYGPYEYEIVEKVPEEQGPPYWIHASDNTIPSYFYSQGDAKKCCSRFRGKYPDRDFKVRQFMAVRQAA